MTRRQGVRAAEDRELALLAERFAPVGTSSARPGGCTSRRCCASSRDENLRMIAESVGFLVAPGQAGRLRRRALLRRLRARSRPTRSQPSRRQREAGAETVVPLRHQRRPRCRRRSPRRRARVVAALAGVARRHPHATTTASARVANSLLAARGGRRARCRARSTATASAAGNANLISIIPTLQLKMGLHVHQRRAARAPHRDGALRRRAAQRRARPHQPYVGATAFAHKGGLHVAAVEQRRSTFEHIDPALVGNEQRVLVSRARRARRRACARRRARARARGRRRARGARAASDVKELEHEGYQFEAADGSFELLLRARARRRTSRSSSSRAAASSSRSAQDGKVETEATIKLHVGGERYHRAPPRATARSTRSTRRCARRSRASHPHLRDIELVNYKVRILDEAKGTGAVTRVLIDASRRRRELGHHRRLREHHRGLLGGARRLARVRHAPRHGGVTASRPPLRVTPRC